MKKIIYLAICCFILAACNHQEVKKQINFDEATVEEDIYACAEAEYAPVSPSAIPLPETNNKTSQVKKIIKDGNMGIQVSNLEKTKKDIDSLVSRYEAYYAKENYDKYTKSKSINLTIRIPNIHFESFIAAIEKGNNEMLYKEIEARDVTENFVDLEIRLENKRNYLSRYQDLLKQAKSVKEILEIEEHIRNIEEEIESTEGSLRYLSNQVDYSTLKLEIKKVFEYTPEVRENFFEKVKQSLSGGWNGVVVIVLFFIQIWPLWIIIGLIYWLIRRITKKRKNKKSTINP